MDAKAVEHAQGFRPAQTGKTLKRLFLRAIFKVIAVRLIAEPAYGTESTGSLLQTLATRATAFVSLQAIVAQTYFIAAA